MKVTIAGFVLDVPPTINPFGSDYAWHKVVKETEKAYMVEHNVMHRNFGTKTKFKWVAKSACKVDENGDVFVPVWLIAKNDFGG